MNINLEINFILLHITETKLYETTYMEYRIDQFIFMYW